MSCRMIYYSILFLDTFLQGLLWHWANNEGQSPLKPKWKWYLENCGRQAPCERCDATVKSIETKVCQSGWFYLFKSVVLIQVYSLTPEPVSYWSPFPSYRLLLPDNSKYVWCMYDIRLYSFLLATEPAAPVLFVNDSQLSSRIEMKFQHKCSSSLAPGAAWTFDLWLITGFVQLYHSLHHFPTNPDRTGLPINPSLSDLSLHPLVTH